MKGKMKESLPAGRQGFTLIELLVVIAIIGILAGIVLTSLGTARSKAKDASAQGSLTSMRAQAEMGIGSDGKYIANMCTTEGTTAGGLKTLLDAAVTQLGTGNAGCYEDGTNRDKWAASGKLSTGNYYCVDYTGYSGDTGVTTNPVGAADFACK